MVAAAGRGICGGCGGGRVGEGGGGIVGARVWLAIGIGIGIVVECLVVDLLCRGIFGQEEWLVLLEGDGDGRERANLLLLVKTREGLLVVIGGVVERGIEG